MTIEQVFTIRQVAVNTLCGIEMGIDNARNVAYLAVAENPDWSAFHEESDRLTELFGEPVEETIAPDGRLYYAWTASEEGIRELIS
ncbi:hypothetical protein [Kitasatospora sp. MBT66]|uniref:hypothetical protein n=1 Tax=Kitasatospora sp. MBT66 TaxID=1444769 RepID=UPI0011EA6302|nr:hypothetical protein [Kitasatospora sp. MBT66]